MEAQVPGSPELCGRVVRAAEAAGFEYLLIPVGSVCWEAWITGAFMAARSSRVQQLAREHGDLLLPHLWTGITRVRPGAGIAVVGNPSQCADTLQQFIDAGCHSFCLSGYLHDEEAERCGD